MVVAILISLVVMYAAANRGGALHPRLSHHQGAGPLLSGADRPVAGGRGLRASTSRAAICISPWCSPPASRRSTSGRGEIASGVRAASRHLLCRKPIRSGPMSYAGTGRDHAGTGRTMPAQSWQFSGTSFKLGERLGRRVAGGLRTGREEDALDRTVALDQARPMAPGLPAGQADPHGRDVYAALDLGTNNCRLLIARPSPNGLHILDAFSRIVRLGENLSATGRLSDAATARTLAALSVCREKMAARKVTRSRLIATEACRAAENGPWFLEEVRRRTGLSVEIVDRETEACLAAEGCAALADQEAESVRAVRYRRGIVRDRLADAGHGGRPGPARARPRRQRAHPGLDFAAARGGVPGRSVRRQARNAGMLCCHDRLRCAGSRALHRTGAQRTPVRALPSAGHLRYRHHGGGRPPWAAALRPAPCRRAMDVRRGRHGSGRQIDRRCRSRSASRMAASARIAPTSCWQAARSSKRCGESSRAPRLRIADRGLREGILIQMMKHDRAWTGLAR